MQSSISDTYELLPASAKVVARGSYAANGRERGLTPLPTPPRVGRTDASLACFERCLDVLARVEETEVHVTRLQDEPIATALADLGYAVSHAPDRARINACRSTVALPDCAPGGAGHPRVSHRAATSPPKPRFCPGPAPGPAPVLPGALIDLLGASVPSQCRRAAVALVTPIGRHPIKARDAHGPLGRRDAIVEAHRIGSAPPGTPHAPHDPPAEGGPG